MTGLRRSAVLCAGLLLILAWGCGDGGGGGGHLMIPEGCNPLNPDQGWDCLLPFPSDVFLVDDPSLPSGRRVEITGAAALVNNQGVDANPLSVHPADGFSHLSQILALFPGGVDPANLVFHTGDVTLSLGADSPTVLLEAESGVRVLHFAELDPRAADDARRALLIRPLVRLRDGTRHIVAIRGLVDRQGMAIEPPEGFRRIRDGEAEGDPVLGPLADHYRQAIFPTLEAAGVAVAGLQLAWDFTTATEEHVTRDLLDIREDLIARFAAAPPVVTIDQVDEDFDPHLARRVLGTIRVPLYLESLELNARLQRGADGRVALNGEAEVPFVALVPAGLAAPGAAPGRVIQFGHGFFGGQDEIQSSRYYELADRLGVVLIAVDWWGMAANDMMAVMSAISSRPSETAVLTDRVHQAMANAIALSFAARDVFPTLDEFRSAGAPLLDPAQLYFYGISNGAILGGTYVALAPLVERAVLSVGGVGYSFMMSRARPFSAFLEIIQNYIPDPLDIQKFITLTQSTFDRIDPVTYAPHVLADTYPDGPAARRVLLQVGLGDTQVPNLASELSARILGVKNLEPAAKAVVGLTGATGPLDGSALNLFDFGIDPLPGIEATPPEEGNQVHDATRWLEATILQLDGFLRPGGLIAHTCDAVCDPE